jgi:hypothetical protein
MIVNGRPQDVPTSSSMSANHVSRNRASVCSCCPSTIASEATKVFDRLAAPPFGLVLPDQCEFAARNRVPTTVTQESVTSSSPVTELANAMTSCHCDAVRPWSDTRSKPPGVRAGNNRLDLNDDVTNSAAADVSDCRILLSPCLPSVARSAPDLLQLYDVDDTQSRLLAGQKFQ